MPREKAIWNANGGFVSVLLTHLLLLLLLLLKHRKLKHNGLSRGRCWKSAFDVQLIWNCREAAQTCILRRPSATSSFTTDRDVTTEAIISSSILRFVYCLQYATTERHCQELIMLGTRPINKKLSCRRDRAMLCHWIFYKSLKFTQDQWKWHSWEGC